MTVVTGVSGSGKSTLVADILYRALARTLYGSREEPGEHGRVVGIDQLDKVIQIDQSPIGRTPRSNPATYTGVFTAIRDLFAMLPESRERGYKPGRFSFNVQGGRCEACQGEGQRRIEMNFLPDVYVLCDVCNGRRYNQETLPVRFNGHSIADLLDLPIADALPILKDIPTAAAKLQTLVDVGLGYIHLGQSATTLSGGEAQRMKLARELSKRQTGRTLYLLDEPTTGLHFDDVRKLLEVLHRLTDLGNTVIIIEHNLDIVRNADYVLDMGPEGGERGGQIIAHGTPEQVATVAGSYTGQFLARHYIGCPRPALRLSKGSTASSIGCLGIPTAETAPHAGPQPINIVAAPDRPRTARGKFVAPEKKTGVPTASAAKPEKSSKEICPQKAEQIEMSLPPLERPRVRSPGPFPKPSPKPRLHTTDSCPPAPRRVPNLGHALLVRQLRRAAAAGSSTCPDGAGEDACDGACRRRHRAASQVATRRGRRSLSGHPAGLLVLLSLAVEAQLSRWSALALGERRTARRRSSSPLACCWAGAMQLVTYFITPPKTLPIDEFFLTSSSAWITTLFGVLVAPVFEEICFRGFLLPAFAIAYDWLSLPRTPEARLALAHHHHPHSHLPHLLGHPHQHPVCGDACRADRAHLGRAAGAVHHLAAAHLRARQNPIGGRLRHGPRRLQQLRLPHRADCDRRLPPPGPHDPLASSMGCQSSAKRGNLLLVLERNCHPERSWAPAPNAVEEPVLSWPKEPALPLPP